MNKPLEHIASLGAIALPSAPEGQDLPEWVQLMPSGEFRAYDGRGPWRVEDAQAVIDASFAAVRKIHIDENHSTGTAAKMGLSAPARGYILQMEARPDGIWGRVDWTEAGARMLRDREYWGISPTFAWDKATGRVLRIKNAALTNDPALTELVALNSAQLNEETGMDLLKELAALLGLPADASAEDVKAAIKKKGAPEAEAATAALGEVGEALGLGTTAGAEQIVAAAAALRAGGTEAGEALASLQAEVKSLRDGEKKRAAEAFVDKAISDKRVGVKAAREQYVSLHMRDAASAEAMVAALPQLGETGLSAQPGKTGESVTALSAEQALFAEQIGLSADDFTSALDADAKGTC